MKALTSPCRSVGSGLILLGLLLLVHAAAAPVESSFTYQGHLSTNGGSANGLFDFTFVLYDQENVSGGFQAGPSRTNAAVNVSSGVFTTILDFGLTPFDGTQRWLQVGVRPSGSSDDFTLLTPRQRLYATPYALSALNAVTPTQLLSSSNVLQTSIANAYNSLSGSLLASNWQLSTQLVNQIAGSSNSLRVQIDGKISATNGTARGLVLTQDSLGAPFPLTIYGINGSDNGYTLSNGYVIDNGVGDWPVAVMRPTRSGKTMPFDLMPNGFEEDVWIDLVSNDLWSNSSYAEYLTLAKRSAFNGGAGEITTEAWGTGVIRPLLLQARGGDLYVGIGSKPISLFRSIAQRHFWTYDGAGVSYLFAQFRPIKNVNISFDNLGNAARLGAFDDAATHNIPMIYQGLSHLFTTDSGRSYGLSFSNNILSATSAILSRETVTTGLLVGANALGPSQIFRVNSLTSASQPWPAMSTAQRNALSPAPPVGSTILNTAIALPECTDGSGNWYRLGQRPAVATSTQATTVIGDTMDVILVKGSGPRSVTLPLPVLYTNRVLEIKDASFSASNGGITITSASGKVEGSTSLVISTDGGAARLVTDGADWFKLN